MTILAQVYSGHTTDDPLIPCLEIDSPAFSEPIRNCAGFEDQTVTLEDGTEATFIASGLDVALPARDDSGQQNLTFAIENVTGEAQLALEEALKAGAVITLVYREYLASDLSAPASKPLQMLVVNGDFKGSTFLATASFRDILSRAWPRERYDTTFAPGLRYL